MTKETPTPETDAIILANAGFGPTDYQWREHARKLERERDEVREEAINKTESIQLAANRIDELKQRSEHWCDMHTIAAIERDEARDQLQAMREAIREVFNSFADEPASDSAWLLDDRQTAALAKLQPFLP